MGDMKEQEN